MINSNNSPLSPISYTNRDFRALFEELLDLTKKLTYKWDPTITNESDPGIILLKLNAIIGDKNNYNIDKNILEAFPETVTQEVSARNMYKQLAYIMPWYQSATTTVSFKWIGEDLEPGESIRIDKFTMLTNAESSIVYTLIDEVIMTYDEPITTGRVIQGIITDLMINGSTEIHLDNLDYNNRVYLNDYNVAENGIFITNANESSSAFWTKVDNLQIEPINKPYFEFGVASRSNSTYVEFPSDIESLIRSGLNIKYVVSDGLAGNIAARQITKFYEDTTIEFRGENLTLNEEVVQMYNPSGTIDGKDPEPVSEAYYSYKKVAGTFDTLVTLRDYINAIYQSGLVSNDIVSDRLTDIQSSYTIVTDSSGSSDKIIEYAPDPDINDNDDLSPYDLSPYDLRLYLLHNGGVMDNITAYESSFDLEMPGGDMELQVQNYIKSTRCMQHNFNPILPNIPCLFRNIYFLRIRFVPQYQLNSTQIISVKQNIMKALFESLNSRELEFGLEADYNLIYDIIINADERIKLVTIDDFNYTTYATYWDANESRFKSIPISEFNSPYIIVRDSKAELDKVPLNKDFKNPERYLYIDSTNRYVYEYDPQLGALKDYSTFIDKFRLDIITKSILAGVTPLYKQDNTFTYTIDQEFNGTDNEVDRVTTDLSISPWGYEKDGTAKQFTPSANDQTQEYTLKENETLQFLAPSFITEVNYSNGTKFEFIMASPNDEGQETVEAKVDNFSTATNTYNKVNTTLYYFNEQKGQLYIYWKFGTKDASGQEVDAGTEYPDGVWKAKESSNYTNKTGFYAKADGKNQSYYEMWRTNDLEEGSVFIKRDIRRVEYDGDYKLREGDSLTVFWKESTEDEAPYLYRCYKGISAENETENQQSPVIKVSFTLNATAPNEAKINPNSLASSGQIPYNSLPNSSYAIVADMWGDNALSGTKTLDIRRMNQVEIKPYENNYYFITNDIITVPGDDTKETKEYYQMVFSPLPRYKANTYYDSTGKLLTSIVSPADWGTGNYYIDSAHTDKINFEYEYTLNTDEYFIYTNKQLSQFELVGPGTYIKLMSSGMFIPIDDDTVKPFTLRVETVAYEDVAMYGLESFVDKVKWVVVNGFIREQQVFNLTGGDKISVTLSPSYDNATYPEFITSEALSLPGDKIKISYQTEGMTGFTALPGIDFGEEEYSWTGRAILNLDSAWDSPQVIDNSTTATTTTENPYIGKYSKQQVIIPKGTESEPSVYPQNVADNSKLYMLCNTTLSKVGGNNVDVTFVDALGERTNIDLFVFSRQVEFSQFPFTTEDTGIITMQLATSEGTALSENQCIVPIQLESGFKYILGIRNASPSGKFRLWYQLNNDAETTFNRVTCLNKPDVDSYGGGNEQNKYYFLLDNLDTENPIVKLKFEIVELDTQGFLEIDPLLKCIENDLFEVNFDISSVEIEAEIPKLDYNGVFKYNVQVQDEVKIENPLEARKFFESQHICNKYTIAQANLRMSDNYEKDSAIMIINNR